MAKWIDVIGASPPSSSRDAIAIEVVADRVRVDVEPDLSGVARAAAGVLRRRIEELGAGVDGHPLFRRTGRLLDSLSVVAIGGGRWAIQVAADRLSGPRAPAILARLAELIPEVADPVRMGDSPMIRSEIDALIGRLVYRASRS